MNPTKKAAPMSKEDTMLLVQLVAANATITNTATDATTNRLKDEAWENLTKEFNSSVSSFPRTLPQLRLKWENLKKSARKRCAKLKTSNYKTGEGKDFIPLEEVLDKVASLLGSTSQGLSVEFGGDATAQTDVSLVEGEDDNFEGDELNLINENNTGHGEVVGEWEVLKEFDIVESKMPRLKRKKIIFNRSSGSGNLAKRKHKLEEEAYKARINRDNAIAEYLMAKKRKLDLENQQRELNLAKCKLDLEKAKLQNLKLKTNLNIT